LWLLIPEHLRLGTWDLLCAWTQQTTPDLAPRLALQLVHEAALCTTGLRAQRALSQNGFELANGLPWLATDRAIHCLLTTLSVAQTHQLQLALGKLRRVSGHFKGRVLAIDPHRLHSHSQRQMRRRRGQARGRAQKLVPTYFVLDAETHQPICFTTATAARTTASASQELLGLAAEILNPQLGQTLVTADAEHFCTSLLNHIRSQSKFDLLVPMVRHSSVTWSQATFTSHWAGYATCIRPYQPRHSQGGPFWQFIQRFGEQPGAYIYKAFLSTTERDPVRLLCEEFPKRWHIEEFFKTDQALGWQRAGTQNLNIRYGQMTMALIAQAVLYQLRQRLGEPLNQWDSKHLANDLLRGLEGDVRVREDTIVVTFYNASPIQHLRPQYEGLPQRLEAEKVDPRIPWLYNFKLDFRFR
jgi:hypothetical protein